MNNQNILNTEILSIATAVPDNLVSTDEMVTALKHQITDNLSESLQHLGIKQRYSIVKNYAEYLAGKHQRELISSTTKLSVQAIEGCLRHIEHKIQNIGLLIAITNTADRPLPCLAFEIISTIDNGFPHDINIINMQNQGCSVLLKSIEMASYYIQANPDKLAIIVAAESHTGYMEKKDKAIYHGFHELHGLDSHEAKATEEIIETFLFGDGAVAILLGNGNQKARCAIGATVHLTNLQKTDTELLTMNEGGILIPEYTHYPTYHMSKEVPKRGAFYAKSCMERLLQKDLLSVEQANFYCIHTGSKKILDSVCNSLNIEANDHRAITSYNILNNYANLSSCSVGFMIADHFYQKTKGTGVIVSFGVGFSASAGIIKFY